jgi:alginate O-acetyltransferase complex protein AlgI
MLFNSIEFILFFPIVVAAYFLLPFRFRWILLLLASYYFYMCWNYKYIVLIIFSTLIDYFVAIHISRAKKKQFKKLLLLFSILSSLGILFFFKYFNFLSENINEALRGFNIFHSTPQFNFLLPVGISFYTFQTMSYTIDVYRGKKEPEKHLGLFAVYVSFFPQLVAGPIERATTLLPQFSQVHTINYERIRNGIVIMLWGFFKKVVIADRLAEYVNAVYSSPHDFGGLQELIATVFFGFQIYCDFSGYSDIAIGSALIMGYTLMVNFKRPYLSTSIREFWQRWHISLSTWFRDYLYIPLGGNRVVKWRWYYNLFITFVISGFWHGANWTFVIWGAMHGMYLVMAIIAQNWRGRFSKNLGLAGDGDLSSFFNLVWTFSLVFLAWIFFRSNTVGDAFVIIRNIIDFKSYQMGVQVFRISSDFYLAFGLIIFLIFIEVLQEKFNLTSRLTTFPMVLKLFLLILIIGSLFILGKWDENSFIYFQF